MGRAGADKRIEYSALVLVAGRQHLGVPLKPQYERVAFAFYAFDQSIFRRCVDDQSLAGLFDRLMMRGVHLDAAAPEDFSKPGALMDQYLVAASFFPRTLLMIGSLGQLRWNVLVERAA